MDWLKELEAGSKERKGGIRYLLHLRSVRDAWASVGQEVHAGTCQVAIDEMCQLLGIKEVV